MTTQELWEAYMPGKVPNNCTYEMFSAAREYMWQQEDLQSNLDRLDVLRKLWLNASNEFKELIELEGNQIKEGI